MADPSIPIEVDQNTGIWSTDGLTMIYMPRHFFLNTHFAAEDALTEDLYAEQLYTTGHKAAWDWSENEWINYYFKSFAFFSSSAISIFPLSSIS